MSRLKQHQVKQHQAARSLPSYFASHIIVTSGVGGVGDRRLHAIGGVKGYYPATAAQSE